MAPCARHCRRHLGIDWRLFTEVLPLTRAQLSFPEAEGRPRREDRCLFPAKGCRRGVQCPPLLPLGTPHLCSEPEPLSPRQHMALWPWPSLPLSNAEAGPTPSALFPGLGHLPAQVTFAAHLTLRSVHPPAHLPTHPPIHLSIHPPTYLPNHSPICPPSSYSLSSALGV